MIISNITKSEKKDGYEVKISFGKYPERIFWCKDKNNIVVRQKRLQKLRCRLRDLIKEFMNIRECFPEQEPVSAEKMVHFLFQYDNVNMEKTVCDFLNAAESEDWDGFYWQYFSQLEWIGSASVEEIKNQLSVETIQGAVAGDQDAVQKVIEHYSDYIDDLCTIEETQEDESTKKIIDEDVRQTVILKLIESLPKFDL